MVIESYYTYTGTVWEYWDTVTNYSNPLYSLYTSATNPPSCTQDRGQATNHLAELEVHQIHIRELNAGKIRNLLADSWVQDSEV